MLSAATHQDRTRVHVKLDFQEMEKVALVSYFKRYLFCKKKMSLCSLLRTSFPASGEIHSNDFFRSHCRGLLGEEGAVTSPFRSCLPTSQVNFPLPPLPPFY